MEIGPDCKVLPEGFYRLVGEKASQEEAKGALQVRREELERIHAELEACLELPVIEELARAWR